MVDVTLNLKPNEIQVVINALRNEAYRIRSYRPNGDQDILERTARHLEKACLPRLADQPARSQTAGVSRSGADLS
jgi:hypothetical protein